MALTTKISELLAATEGMELRSLSTEVKNVTIDILAALNDENI